MARSTSGESVLERAARILEVFDKDTFNTSVSDIAAKAGLPLSTASRIIDELICHGFLSRDLNRRIQIGARLWELGCKASPAGWIREAAMPALSELHRALGHHVLLGVVENDDAVFIERLYAANTALSDIRLAARIPLHASACGLVLLAHAAPSLRHRAMSSALHRYTDSTITDPRQVRETLTKVRRSGWAICPGFINPRLTAIAVPVRDANDAVVAAISVLIPRAEPASGCITALTTASESIHSALSAGTVRSAAGPGAA